MSSKKSNQQSKMTTRINTQQNQKRCGECQDVDSELKIAFKKTEKIKKQNDVLRKDLRNISKQLDETLDKVKQNRIAQKGFAIEPEKKKELLQKELKAAQASLKTYKKQLKALENKMGGGYDVDKITAMLRLVKNREHELNEVQVENKTLTKLKRDSDRVLAKEKPEYILNSLRDEILMTKSLINEAKKVERIQEKNTKKQEEFITKLDLKHREICETVDAEYEVLKPTKEELFPGKDLNKSTIQEITVKKDRSRQPLYQTIEKEIDDDDMELNKQTFDGFEEKIKQIKETMEINKENNLKKMNKLKLQFEIVENSNLNVNQQIEQKEKDILAAKERLRELKNIFDQDGGVNLKGYYLQKQDEENKRVPKDLRTQAGGVVQSSEDARSFEDAQFLPKTKDYQINEVRVIHQDKYILSLEVEYRLKNGELQVVKCFKNSQDAEDQKLLTLKLKGTEYISQIQGYYNNNYIQYLKIMSSRGNYLMAGSQQNLQSLKQFQIQIQKDEKPISFFGTVDKLPRIKKNIGRESEYCLVSFGVELRKKQNLKSYSKDNINKLKSNNISQYLKSEQQKRQKQQAELEGNEEYQEFEEHLPSQQQVTESSNNIDYEENTINQQNNN